MLDVTPDPYPDLLGAEPPDPVLGADDGRPRERPELSEADSRLLDALSRKEPAVVAAVEDEPWGVRALREDGVAASRPAGRGGPLTPVFQEPDG